MISVIIPVYNAERYLRRCADSVLGSSYPDFELLLVDDGSTDGSARICEDYAQRDRRVRVFRQENRGVSAARNRGIRESRGEWLVFVDADDRISGDFLGLVAEHRGPDLLFFDLAGPSGAEGTGAVYRYEGGAVAGLAERVLVPRPLPEGGAVNLVSCQGKAYRRPFLEQAGVAFSPELFYGEDRLFNLEYLLRARRCAHISAPVYFYEEHRDSASHRYGPPFLDNHAVLAEKLKAALEEQRRYGALEGAYASCVLSHLVSLLVYVVFDGRGERSFGECRALCRRMREAAVFQEALGHCLRCGSLRRRMLLYAFRRGWDLPVGLACRAVHKWRGDTA